MAGQFDAYYPRITQTCKEAFLSGGAEDPIALATAVMELEGFPMHAPLHHYLVPAVLLTVCRKAQGHDCSVLERDLEVALERACGVPGGSCGFYGACGAGVGVGIFWSVITDCTPLSDQVWGYSNGATGKALTEIAAVGGPRCCKRCTYLALESTLEQIRSVLELDVRAVRPSCHFSDRNTECLGARCPYHPEQGRLIPIVLPVFAYPKKDPEHPCPCQDRPMELTHKSGLLFWKKQEGDAVAGGEAVAELEVEKKTLEILAPEGGVLHSRCVPEGGTVGGADPIGYLTGGKA